MISLQGIICKNLKKQGLLDSKFDGLAMDPVFPQDCIPTMTSNTAPFNKAIVYDSSGNVVDNSDAYKVFDKNSSTYCTAKGGQMVRYYFDEELPAGTYTVTTSMEKGFASVAVYFKSGNSKSIEANTEASFSTSDPIVELRIGSSNKYGSAIKIYAYNLIRNA